MIEQRDMHMLQSFIYTEGSARLNSHTFVIISKRDGQEKLKVNNLLPLGQGIGKESQK